MAQPSINQIATFDASKPYAILYNYEYEIKSTEVQIYNNQTGLSVFNQTFYGINNQIILLSNSIVNNGFYSIKIQVKNTDDSLSLWSTESFFHCVKTPTINFTNVSDGGVIEACNYSFAMTYSQSDGELLDTYQVQLYDASYSLLNQSDIIREVGDLHYEIKGLENNKQYKIRMIGTTVNGLLFESDYISFSVAYDPLVTQYLVETENLDNGAIRITSNMTSIMGEIVGNVTFGDSSITIPIGASVSYLEGYKIIVDFTADFIISDIVPYSNFLIFSNGIKRIKLWYRYDTFSGNSDTKCYFLLTADGATNMEYQLRTSYFDIPTIGTKFHIIIVKKNGMFDLTVTVL